MMADIDDIVINPKAHFDKPDDVVHDRALSVAEKKRILEAWHKDALALERAKDEGMEGGEESWLAKVTEALDALEELSA